MGPFATSEGNMNTVAYFWNYPVANLSFTSQVETDSVPGSMEVHPLEQHLQLLDSLATQPWDHKGCRQ